MIKEMLIEALKEFGPVAFEQYQGKKETYFVYNYEDEKGVGYADDDAQYQRHFIQIHYYTPNSMYNETDKSRIRRKILDFASVTKTHTTKETDTNLMHVIFSTEIDIPEGQDGNV